ncbi:MAG TPA: RHS repeat-associated core domain-containing protein [Polyangia bacterium]
MSATQWDGSTAVADVSYGYDLLGNLTSVTDASQRNSTYLYDDLGRLLIAAAPDSGATNYSYTARGGVKKRVDAIGRTVTYTYDSLGRVLSETGGTGGSVTYWYDTTGDSRGRLHQVTDTAGTTTFAYDAEGHLLSEARQNGTHRSYTTRYEAALDPRPEPIGYPDGSWLRPTVDSANPARVTQLGRVDPMLYGLSLAVNVVWHSGLRVRGFTYGNGVTLTRTLTDGTGGTQAGLPGAITAISGPFTILQRTHGEADWQGRPTSITGAGDGPYTYTYDTRGRLARTQAANSAGAGNTYFRFNGDGDGGLEWLSLGDRVQQRVCGTSSCTPTAYVYDSAGAVTDAQDGTGKLGEVAANDRLYWAKSSTEEVCYDYDASGNLTWEAVRAPGTATTVANACKRDGTVSYTAQWCYRYDDWGRLQQMGSAATSVNPCVGSNFVAMWRFDYDWKGRRVSRLGVSQNAGWLYSYGKDDRLLTEIGTSWTGSQWTDVIVRNFYYLAGELLAQERFATSTCTNTVGNVSVPSCWQTLSPTKVYYYHNDFLGTPQAMTNSTADLVWSARYNAFGVSGITQRYPDADNPWRFPGQYDDNAKSYANRPGPYYNYHRYYDPAIGRYMQADPLLLEAVEGHPYSYVDNSPLAWIDPDGLFRLDPRTAKNPRYACLRKWFSEQAGKLAANSFLNQTLGEVTHASARRIKGALTSGRGPIIKVGKCPDGGVYGCHTRNSPYLTMSAHYLDECCSTKNLLESKVLHEFVHYLTGNRPGRGKEVACRPGSDGPECTRDLGFIWEQRYYGDWTGGAEIGFE